MRRSTFIAGSLAATAFPLRALARAHIAQRVAPIVASIPGSVGVYARTLDGGPPLYAYNAQESFPSASTIKVLIMLTAFTAAQDKRGVMESHVYYDRDADLIGGSDFLATQSSGTFTVRELIKPMIQVSDNTASNLLISHFGFPLINQVTRRAGLYHTHLKRHFLDTAAVIHHMDNRTTPQDMAHLLYEIERSVREGLSTVATPESCRAMIEIMLGQTDRDTIPKLLPPGVPVANKTGELSRSRSDVAIIDPFGDSPYVLTVYANELDSPGEAYSGIAELSRVVYQAVQRYKQNE